MGSVTWVHRCMIVPTHIAVLCRELAASLDPAGAWMWTTQLSATGNLPTTHYISSGLIDQLLADLLESPEALSEGVAISLDDAFMILSLADISEEDPHQAMDRLGLMLISKVEL